MSVLLLAGLLAAGVSPIALGAVWLAYAHPGWFLAAVGARVVWARARLRRREPDAEIDFLQGMVAELGAGASLRWALREAAARAPDLKMEREARLALAGRPMREVTARIPQLLPVTGRLAGAAFELAGATGGRAAPIFAGLATRALETAEISRERRALTAQARMSAWVMVAAGTVAVGVLALSGRVGVLWGSGSALRGLLLVGLLLQGCGLSLVWWMASRSVR